jgi:hypothetical protein
MKGKQVGKNARCRKGEAMMGTNGEKSQMRRTSRNREKRAVTIWEGAKSVEFPIVGHVGKVVRFSELSKIHFVELLIIQFFVFLSLCID